ncbi:hypothetical protein DPSP01_013154 [Paraphaeosphaeria sporulosa]
MSTPLRIGDKDLRGIFSIIPCRHLLYRCRASAHDPLSMLAVLQSLHRSSSRLARDYREKGYDSSSSLNVHVVDGLVIPALRYLLFSYTAYSAPLLHAIAK